MGRIGGGIAVLVAITAVASGPAASDRPAAEREYFASRTIQLCYDVLSGGDVDVTEVELWITRDQGRSWSLFEGVRMDVTPEGEGLLTIDLPGDGEYGLKIVAVESDGMAEGRPASGEAPGLVAVIDTAPPEIHIEAPTPGSWAKAGARLAVKWSCSDAQLALDPVEIDSSSDGGATWTRVVSGLPASGECFIDLPSVETPDFRIRLRARDRAGNVGTRSLARGVVVRAQRPAGEPERFTSETLPPTRSNSLEFDIEYAVDDVGTAGLQSVVLWWTEDGGATWRSGGRDEDLVSPFRFRAPRDGTYGFVLQAIDNAHRASVPDPAPGSAPHRVTIVDTEPPEVKLLKPLEGPLAGGARCDIEWTASDANLGPTPVTVLWSVDGGISWSPLCSTPLPNSGAFTWDVPAIVSSRVRLKVSVVDIAGNVSESKSGNIVLTNPSSAPPRVQILGVTSATSLVPIGDVRIEKAPDPPPAAPKGAAYERGKILRAQGKTIEALDAFREELAAHPDHLEAANDLGVVLTELNDSTGAVEAFQWAKRISPSDPEVRFNLASALLAARRPRDAIQEGRDALATLPKQSDLALRFARLLWKTSVAALEARDLDAAREAWRAIAAIDHPDNRWRESASEMLRRYGN